MKKNLNRSALYLALLAANQATGAGLYLNEFGDFSAGRASAGAAAGTDEAATIIHNPASATGIENSALFLGSSLLFPSNQFDIEESRPAVGDDDGGDAGKNAATLNSAYVYSPDSSRWSLGVYMASLAGSGLNYRDDWVGRYQVTEVELLVAALAPTIAYQLTDRLSIGVAPQLYYASLNMDIKVPNLVNPGGPDIGAKLDGDDAGFGYTAGITYEFSEATRIGLAYQSELDINFDGDLEARSGNPDFPVSSEADSNTQMDFAEKVRLGFHHDLNEAFGLDFTVGWEGWSSLDQVFISIPSRGGALQTDWDDVWHYAAGFQYAVDEEWDLTAGVAYDDNPVSSQNRTADLPVDRQVRYNLGLRRALSQDLTVGGLLTYADLGSAQIDARFFSGDYKNNRYYQVGAYFNWAL